MIRPLDFFFNFFLPKNDSILAIFFLYVDDLCLNIPGIKKGIVHNFLLFLCNRKHQLKERVGMEPSSFRLRKANFWEEPDAVLSDELRSLEGEGIHDGDLVYFEEGEVWFICLLPFISIFFFFLFYLLFTL